MGKRKLNRLKEKKNKQNDPFFVLTANFHATKYWIWGLFIALSKWGCPWPSTHFMANLYTQSIDEESNIFCLNRSFLFLTNQTKLLENNQSLSIVDFQMPLTNEQMTNFEEKKNCLVFTHTNFLDCFTHKNCGIKPVIYKKKILGFLLISPFYYKFLLNVQFDHILSKLKKKKNDDR